MLRALSLALASSVVAATAAPMSRVDNRWIRSLEFPRPQIAGLGLVAIAGLLARRHRTRTDKVAAVATGLAVAYHARNILPFTRLHKREVLRSTREDPNRMVRILSCNIMLENRHPDRFLQTVREQDPDVVCVLEADDWWTERLAQVERDRPHTMKLPQDNYYGMLLYSRLPIVDQEVQFLIKKDVPSFRARLQLRTGDLVDLYCLHPEPPPYEHTSERDSELMLTGLAIRKSDVPSIVIGDLNDVAWSKGNREFLKLSGLLDPRVGRGFYHTFDARSVLVRYPIDHIFHTAEFRLGELSVLKPIGSDHHPVLIELSFEPEVEAEQPAPEPDQEAIDITRRRLAEARERFDEDSQAKTTLTIEEDARSPETSSSRRAERVAET